MPIIESRYGGPPFYQRPYAQGPFPLDVCPPIIADAAGEVSWRLKIPIEMAAQAALGATSLSVQNYVNVQCPGYEPAPVSLILLTISNSSGGKSLMERCFLRAVSTLERRQDDEFNGQMVAFQAEMKIWLDDERQLAKECSLGFLGECFCLRLQILVSRHTFLRWWCRLHDTVFNGYVDAGQFVVVR